MIRIATSLCLLLGLFSTAADAFAPFDKAGIDQHPGAAIPMDIPFVDADGRATTLKALGSGRPIALVPVLHNCPNICGVTLAGLAQAIQAQKYRPGQDFTVIAFGIDPQEHPADARAALDKLAAAFPVLRSPAIHGLTGTADHIARVTQSLGYRYAWDSDIGQYAHVAATAILTPQGRLSRWLYGIAPEPTDLELSLTEAGQGQLGSWKDQLLLLCYHYDPKTGRYGSLVTWLLRLSGGIFVAAGAAWIGYMIMRDRRGVTEAARWKD